MGTAWTPQYMIAMTVVRELNRTTLERIMIFAMSADVGLMKVQNIVELVKMQASVFEMGVI
jgi:hypothetical protein